MSKVFCTEHKGRIRMWAIIGGYIYTALLRRMPDGIYPIWWKVEEL